jgi:hypothetical protein
MNTNAQTAGQSLLVGPKIAKLHIKELEMITIVRKIWDWWNAFKYKDYLLYINKKEYPYLHAWLYKKENKLKLEDAIDDFLASPLDDWLKVQAFKTEYLMLRINDFFIYELVLACFGDELEHLSIAEAMLKQVTLQPFTSAQQLQVCQDVVDAGKAWSLSPDKNDPKQ